jgi:class 3 adenylate cyclase/predicted ATPase
LAAGNVCTTCFTLLPPNAQYCFHCGSMVIGAQNTLGSGQPMIVPQQIQAAPDSAPLIPQPHAPVPASGTSTVTVDVPLSGSVSDLLPSLKNYLPTHLYEPLERRPTLKHLKAVFDHMVSLLRTTKTYLPRPVVESPQPGGVPVGSMRQGTFLFVDVTGFTALSERLAKYGRAGAERVTEIMNSLFDEVVGVLYRHDGSLLKFGGDAILGVFDGVDEEEMQRGAHLAVQAALAMQAVMGKFAAIEAGGQTSALRIKVGIATGPYFSAQVGTTFNMGYVTTGRTVNRTELCEDHAEPGEVILHQATYELVKDHVVVSGEIRDEEFYNITDIQGDLPQPSGQAILIPQDENPDGALEEQLVYLVNRMNRLEPYLASDLLPRLINNPDSVEIAPENRPVTVMFANYVGMAELIEDMGETRPDIITQQLNNYFVHMAEIVEQYEGTLARMDHYAVGDRLVIFFGAPRAHEDDPLRAVYTAIDMQAATRKKFAALQTPEGIYRFRQRIGINTGYLFAGNVGAANLRQEYTLMGDDINMAARMMSKADWAEIFVTDQTESRVSAYITLEDKGGIKVKGKELPVPTFRVVARRQEVGQTRGLAGGESPLIGRKEALETAIKAAETAIGGRGQIVSIIGDSGRGKSRLVRELKKVINQREDVDKILWLEGQALSFTEEVNYWMIGRILYGALGLSPDANPDDVLFGLWEKGEEILGRDTAREAVPFLAYVLDIDLEGEWAGWIAALEPAARQKQIFWALREFFKTVAGSRTTIIVLDDLHWADEASLAICNDLISIADSAAILFVLVFREMRDKGVWSLRDRAESNFKHRYTQIELLPLSNEECEELLAAVLPGAKLDSETRMNILEKAAGNPFYLEEIVRALIDGQGVIPDEKNPGHWTVTDTVKTISVPDTLQGAIVSRIDRLTEDARSALQIAAVIGRRFQIEMLRSLVGEQPELNEWLAQLERTGMILSGGEDGASYDFPDTMVQEVAYESMMVQRRQEIHRMIGESLEKALAEQGDAAAGILAYHFSRSDDREKAVRYLEKAASQAQSGFANSTALHHYTDLLNMLGNSEEIWQKRYSILNHRQKILGVMGKQTEREADLTIMLDLAEAHQYDEGKAETLNGFADLYQWTGRYEESIQTAQAALILHEQLKNQAGQALSQHILGVVYYYRGEYDLAQTALEKAIAIRRKTRDQAGESWSRLYQYMIHLVKGNYAEASDINEGALWKAQALKDWMLIGIHLNNGGRIATRLGEYEKALEFYAEASKTRVKIGDRAGLSFTLFGQAMTYYSLNRLDDAEAALQESISIRRQINDERGLSSSLAALGMVALERGDLETAEDGLSQARALHEKLALKGELVTDLSYLGQVYQQQGKEKEALEVSQQAIDMLAEQKNVEEVQQVYLNHYRVLKAQGSKSAKKFLKQADATMQQQASAISDEKRRTSFLKNVKVNQAIAAEMDGGS